jgi:GT2 family glycosyltransferase
MYCFNLDNEDADLMRRTLDFGDVDGTIRRLSRERRWLDLREEFYRSRPEPLHELPAPWLLYWTGNVSARTEQLRRVGGFDEAFVTWGFEDVDLGCRLWLDGARFVLDRAASVIHHPHEKDFAPNEQPEMTNRRYLAGKYDTPAARLLAAEPALDFAEIDQILRQRG